jgi:ubiquinone/menaquinone biosynthesis C-methylase UbiE
MSGRPFSASLAERLDRPDRASWLSPSEVIRAIDVKADETIADIGAGTGYFSLPLAAAVGARGKVYALDSQLEMLQLLDKKLVGAANESIRPLHATASETFLPSAQCDLVFMANVWHEFSDRPDVLRESKRILKRLGRIAILDWRPDVEPEHGPPLGHRLSGQSAVEDLACAGFAKISLRNIGRYSWLVQAITSPSESTEV